MPGDVPQQLDILAGQGEGGDDHIAIATFRFKGFGILGAIAAVVNDYLQVGCKGVQFPLPVAQYGRRGNQQGRRQALDIRCCCLLSLLHQAGNHLHRLAQAHVIGQTAIQPQPLQIVQPRQTPFLVIPQVSL